MLPALARNAFKNSRSLHRRTIQSALGANVNEALDFSEILQVKSLATEGDTFQVHSVWLRHHCPCPECYNHTTQQRQRIPSDLRNISNAVKGEVKGDIFQVSWKDGHFSEFSVEWLRKLVPKRITSNHIILPQQNLIDYVNLDETTVGSIFRNVQSTPNDALSVSVPFSEFMMENSSGLSQLLKNILNFGYGIVSNSPPDSETTKKVIGKVAEAQNTLYGSYYQWSSNLAFADTAYTSDLVRLHTDTSYFTEPMGLQIFHCLKHEGTGGINTFVDGFQVARKMALEYPELYKVLATVPVPYQYIDGGKHEFRSNGQIFGHDWIQQSFNHIWYNPHDMSVLSQIPFEKVEKFYEALVLLSDLLEENPTQIKLNPGLIIFLDNWRMLHGRYPFQGLRHMCGAYISRSDWLSKARVLKLLE